jgi:hypothetical protein
MRTYDDDKGRRWVLRIDVAAARRIATFAGIDLVADPPDKWLAMLRDDPVAQAETFYAIVWPTCGAAAAADVLAGFRGDALRDIASTVLDAVTDFFPPPPPDGAKPRSEDDDDGPAESGWPVVYRLAGMCGVDPGPLTLRELVWMVEGHGRDAWERTSTLCALMVNTSPARNPKAKPIEPGAFNPYRPRRRRRREGFEIGKDVSWADLAGSLGVKGEPTKARPAAYLKTGETKP